MLTVKNLNIDFFNQDEKKWVSAVKQINFYVKKGTILGIVGESGSGKSVTSFSILRLHDERTTLITGEIGLNNVSLLNLNVNEIRHYRGNQISMIFQEPMTSLNPVFTCGYQVAETIMMHQKVNKTEAKRGSIELFKEVQLPGPEDLFDSYPHQISGGQKQRIMIAMALSCNPELLIADEPTTTLYVTVQKTILELLLKLKEERHMSMIFISHDLNVVHEIADDLIVMYKGEIVEQGKAKLIFQNPVHPYTKGLPACRPSPTLQLKRLRIVADFIKGLPDIAAAHLNPSNQITASEIQGRRNALYVKQPLLEIINLCTWYPTNRGFFSKKTEYVKAVDGISFKVFPGETLGLVGESGCGKTTLGRSILRLIEPTSGSIIFEGKDITHLGKTELRKLRKDIQIIFQDQYASLNPKLTIGQSVIEPLQVYNRFKNNTKRKAKVLELFSKVGLKDEYYNRYPHEFSGGQRQRVVIVRALALEPRFIICDESVSASDLSVQAQVLNLIKDLQKEFGLTNILISHNLAIVKHISDRILVMNKGKIEEERYPEKIFNAPKAVYTKKLIDAIPGV